MASLGNYLRGQRCGVSMLKKRPHNQHQNTVFKKSGSYFDVGKFGRKASTDT